MFKNNSRPVLLLGILLVAATTAVFTKPILNTSKNTSQPILPTTSPQPTPTPALILLTGGDDSYSFVIPSSWTTESSTLTEKATVSNLKACGDLVLSIRELPAIDPQTNRPLSAKKYLSLSPPIKYSRIDGLRAIVVSESSPSGQTKPYARAVIESTPSGQLIDFYYQPVCHPDLPTGQEKDFFPLLKSIRFKFPF